MIHCYCYHQGVRDPMGPVGERAGAAVLWCLEQALRSQGTILPWTVAHGEPSSQLLRRSWESCVWPIYMRSLLVQCGLSLDKTPLCESCLRNSIETNCLSCVRAVRERFPELTLALVLEAQRGTEAHR